MKKLEIVLDTNILLAVLPEISKYHIIFQKLVNEEFDLFISNEILLEYEEIISKKTNQIIAKKTTRLLLELPNIYEIIPYYRWNLINIDPDDNKFVDCAVSGNADYLVTNDKHFDILKT